MVGHVLALLAVAKDLGGIDELEIPERGDGARVGKAHEIHDDGSPFSSVR